MGGGEQVSISVLIQPPCLHLCETLRPKMPSVLLSDSPLLSSFSPTTWSCGWRALCCHDKTVGGGHAWWWCSTRQKHYKRSSFIPNRTLECPWRASHAMLGSTATAPWCRSMSIAPHETTCSWWPSHASCDVTLSSFHYLPQLHPRMGDSRRANNRWLLLLNNLRHKGERAIHHTHGETDSISSSPEQCARSPRGKALSGRWQGRLWPGPSREQVGGGNTCSHISQRDRYRQGKVEVKTTPPQY